MLDWYLSAQSSLQAELMGPEHPSDDPDTHFSPTIGLTVSGMALFGARPSRPSTEVFRTSTACLTSERMAGSPSLFKMILAWPSHEIDETTHLTAYMFSSAPCTGSHG